MLPALQADLTRRYAAALDRYSDPIQAAASLECSEAEMERALRQLGEPCGPMDWIQRLPWRAKALMRRLGFIVF